MNMNKFVMELLSTMNKKQLREIFLSLSENEKDDYCSYIKNIRSDLTLFCKELKNY